MLAINLFAFEVGGVKLVKALDCAYLSDSTIGSKSRVRAGGEEQEEEEEEGEGEEFGGLDGHNGAVEGVVDVVRFVADDDEVVVGSVGNETEKAELCRYVLSFVLSK
ncbi:hypothetical protein AA0112_g10567 [Alternaria arborescens]|uniref:hypothetical protein n=1 Tax=Alternaria arborescens TaxID=156630 RepID=UPI001074B7F5|nr:hypothetical protein AA0111_g8920 [Alternaria arborescens]RYN20683.1 hypothetical protein AA0112_g10567 [Alternaria arborescens]RYO24066.1 hypothetical protein AA0111_g8920 [Alternaria arborescens]